MSMNEEKVNTNLGLKIKKVAQSVSSIIGEKCALCEQFKSRHKNIFQLKWELLRIAIAK